MALLDWGGRIQKGLFQALYSIFHFVNHVLPSPISLTLISLFLPSKMSTPYDLPSDLSSIKKFEWDDHYDFPRDLVGYGEKSFNPQWPNGAKIAVSFVINYEEVNQSLLIYQYFSIPNPFRVPNTLS